MATKIPLNLKIRCGVGRGKKITLTLTDGAGDPLDVTDARFGIGTPTPIQGTGAIPSAGVVVFLIPSTATASAVPGSGYQFDAAVEIAGDPDQRRDVIVGTFDLDPRIASFT